MFKEGDKVLINPDSVYFDSIMDNNPRNTFGYIQGTDDFGDHYISVKWVNGGSNLYREVDLVHVMDKCDVIYSEGHIFINSKYLKIIATSKVVDSKENGVDSIKTVKLPNNFLEKFKDLTYNGHKIKNVNVEYNNNFSIKTIVIDLNKDKKGNEAKSRKEILENGV